MDKREKYLITGAGGFIGGWIAETLCLEGKASIRACIHRWSGAPRLARFPMEIVPCDIMNIKDIEKAIKGVSHIIHCAKGASSESIIKGTENMLELAYRNGIKRFVHMSTAEVYGNPSGLVDENYKCMKTGKIYGDSKLEAEHLCLEYQSKGLPLTILRPSIVYGPFSKTWILNIGFKLLSRGWGTFKEEGEGICNLIYISDLVKATLCVSREERAIGEVFNLNGPETPTWNEYFTKFNAALSLPELNEINPGRTKLRSSLMVPIRASAKFARNHFEHSIKKMAAGFSPAKFVLENLEKTIKLTPRPADLSLYNRKAYYSAEKIKKLLGIKSVVDVETGLKQSVLWLDQVGIRW